METYSCLYCVLYFGRRICDSVACLCSVRAVEAPHGDASDLDTADAQFNCCSVVRYTMSSSQLFLAYSFHLSLAFHIDSSALNDGLAHAYGRCSRCAGAARPPVLSAFVLLGS